MNPSGGQFASLSDFVTLARAMLDPTRHPLDPHQPGPLSKATLTHWLKPSHSFEEDDWTETGLVWEIVKHLDSYGRRRRIYWKCTSSPALCTALSARLMRGVAVGNLENFQAAFALHPGSGYAALVLLAGRYPDAGALAYDAFDAFQPAVDAALADAVAVRYAGRWRAEDGRSEAVLRVDRGTLWVERYVLEKADVLRVFGAEEGEALALREVRPDEFRCAACFFHFRASYWRCRSPHLRVDAGMPGWGGKRHMGCMGKWVNLDWGMKNSAGVNVVYFASGEDGEWELRAPAVGVSMRRVL